MEKPKLTDREIEATRRDLLELVEHEAATTLRVLRAYPADYGPTADEPWM